MTLTFAAEQQIAKMDDRSIDCVVKTYNRYQSTISSHLLEPARQVQTDDDGPNKTVMATVDAVLNRTRALMKETCDAEFERIERLVLINPLTKDDLTVLAA